MAHLEFLSQCFQIQNEENHKSFKTVGHMPGI
jgi:hypothetical protein